MSAVTTDPAVAAGRLLSRPASLGRRRPVQSFVGIVALASLVLLAAGRSGVVAPQVVLSSTGSLGDGTTSCASTYAIVNEGYRPVRVEQVAWAPGARLADPATDLRSPQAQMTLAAGDIPAFAPFTLPGRSRRELVVPFPCAQPPVDGPVVHVRSVDLGLLRTVRW